MPKNLLFKTSLELPIYDLLNLCQTDKKCYNKLCKNDFWKVCAIEIWSYMLTKDYDLYINSDDFKNIDDYQFITVNIKDIQTSDRAVVFLILN